MCACVGVLLKLPLPFCRFVLGVDGSGGWVVLRIGLLM